MSLFIDKLALLQRKINDAEGREHLYLAKV